MFEFQNSSKVNLLKKLTIDTVIVISDYFFQLSQFFGQKKHFCRLGNLLA